MDRKYEGRPDPGDMQILAYLKQLGPDYAKLLAFRFGEPLEEMRCRLQVLEEAGLIERVEGRIVTYHHRRLKAVKHRNHTYYALTREGEHLLRRLGSPEVPFHRPKR